MTVLEYIDSFGDYTFQEKKFNEVDAMTFASLSYIDYKDVLNNPFKLELSMIGNLILKKFTKKDIKESITAVRTALAILDKMYLKKRYKNCKLYNYVYKFNSGMQYSSVFIDISSTETVVSYEGTDELISGWFEDGELAYKFPVPAHKLAIKNLNYNIGRFSKRKYTIVGHSKGGNLALVASMYAKPYIIKKIKNIYSFDGPGLRNEEFSSLEYANVLDKYHLIIPNYSIVGLLLNNNVDYKVVKSTNFGPFAHDLISWVVEDNHLKEAKLSRFSIKFDKAITKWNDSLSYFEREQFAKDLFKILDRAGIKTLYDIRGKNMKNIFKVISESKKIDVKSEEIIKDMIKIIFLEMKD